MESFPLLPRGIRPGHAPSKQKSHRQDYGVPADAEVTYFRYFMITKKEKKLQTTQNPNPTQPSLFLLCIVSDVAKFHLFNLMYNFKQSESHESGKVDIDHCFRTRQVNSLAKFKNLNLKITRDYDLQKNPYIFARLLKLVSGIHNKLLPSWVFCLFEQKCGIFANIPEIQ